MAWTYGEVIVHREIAWGRPWLALPEIVVTDTDDLLVTYIAPGAPFGFAAGEWPTETGRHPWQPRTEWTGHGVLVVQRPGDAYAVWHFWTGDDRRFERWYLNLQAPLRRTPIGYDTQDRELDVVVRPDGTWTLKDDELLEQRVSEGRYSAAEVVEIRALGAWMTNLLDVPKDGGIRRTSTGRPIPRGTRRPLAAGWEDLAHSTNLSSGAWLTLWPCARSSGASRCAPRSAGCVSKR